MSKHNHMTRDVKPRGECPACDALHDTFDFEALAAEAEEGYWCREPVGGGKTCDRLGRRVKVPPTPDRTVLCEQHRKGWGREL